MSTTQNNRIEELSDQFGKQALLSNCENDQKVGASKAGGYPTSLDDHKAGEFTGAMIAGKGKTGGRAFAADITNKGHKDGVAQEGADKNSTVLHTSKAELTKATSNPANLGPGSKGAD